jgi:hypothetical protein
MVVGRSLTFAAGLLMIGAVACTSHDDHESQRASAVDSTCAWIAGRWAWSGCGETECTLYEDGCTVHYTCTSPSNLIKGEGAIVGSSFTFGGGQCTASIAGKMISGQCPSCTFTATHR